VPSIQNSDYFSSTATISFFTILEGILSPTTPFTKKIKVGQIVRWCWNTCQSVTNAMWTDVYLWSKFNHNSKLWKVCNCSACLTSGHPRLQ